MWLGSFHTPAATVGTVTPGGLPVSAPPRVRAWLAAAPDGEVRVLHRGHHAAYVEVAGRCVGVAGTAAAALPCALRLATPGLGALTAARAEVRDGVLHLDGTGLRVVRLVDTRAPRLATPRRALSPAAATAADRLATRIGSGPGLTPESDDVLCGWLAVVRAAGLETPALDARVRAASARTTLLSATLLDCALHGETLPVLAAWLAARGTPAEDARAAALARVGHTSGAALLRGARLALAHLDAAAGEPREPGRAA